MGRFCLDLSEHSDVLDFQERLSAMSPKDRLIAECIMAGMTQAETGREVGLTGQRVGQRLRNLIEFFAQDFQKHPRDVVSK